MLQTMAKGPRGPKGERRPGDAFQRARMVARIATGEIEDNPAPEPPTASEMGQKGGAARAKSLDPERRRQIAKKAAEKRWGKKPAS